MSYNNNNSNNNSNNNGKKPVPTIKKMMDDDIEEVTRRVGGRGAPAPSMVAPNFGAMQMPFQLPGGTSSMQMPTGFAPQINTAPMKAPAMQMQAPAQPQVFVWKLQTVPALPEMYELEKTAAFVPHSTPAMVAERVSDVLRERSIEASYDDDKAKVTCNTTDGVNFRIRLHRGRNKYSHGIIVEVQRRLGTSISFHQHVKAILDAAEGKDTTPPTQSMNVLPMVYDEEEEDDYVPPPTSKSSSLVMISKILSFSAQEDQVLGMQTLSSLVDPAKMGPQTARAVGHELMRDTSEVGAKVLQYILSRPQADDEVAMNLRITSLGVLSHALKSTGKVPEFVRSELRTTLLRDLREAEKQPRAALMAAKCMEHFVKGDHDTMELNEAFEMSLKVGQSRHKELMRASERCILKIR
mmetsp:Transcript_15922/g.44628  ORF Transcript_15922/g.44628 Transcript_15922/m.44628 type:complete len:410 (-) Transcript_15922:384-1613(-)